MFKLQSSKFIYYFSGLWNHVFLFSNLSLFVLLPFAYLFTESSGFFGHRSGVMSRVYETFTVLLLLAGIVFGLTYVISAFIDDNTDNSNSLRKFFCLLIKNRKPNVFYFFRSMELLSTIFILVCIIYWCTNVTW